MKQCSTVYFTNHFATALPPFFHIFASLQDIPLTDHAVLLELVQSKYCLRESRSVGATGLIH